MPGHNSLSLTFCYTFFGLLKGDYDALLSWPFNWEIVMMLLDQGSGDHVREVLHRNPQSSSFQQPQFDMNVEYGVPQFMPLESLDNREYIKDDVMFIKMVVFDPGDAAIGSVISALP